MKKWVPLVKMYLQFSFGEGMHTFGVCQRLANPVVGMLLGNDLVGSLLTSTLKYSKKAVPSGFPKQKPKETSSDASVSLTTRAKSSVKGKVEAT